MPNYQYPNDGKLHTRWSELIRCTPGQVERVVLERWGEFPKYENDHMRMGTIRHEQFCRESQKTGYIPEVFHESVGKLAITDVEHYVSNELLPGVVVHSTIDAFLDGDYVADYKTTSQDAKVYQSSKQMLLYALQLRQKGIKINRKIYLLEKWDKEHEHIVDWEYSDNPITDRDLDDLMPWLEERVFILREGEKLMKERKL